MYLHSIALCYCVCVCGGRWIRDGRMTGSQAKHIKYKHDDDYIKKTVFNAVKLTSEWGNTHCLCRIVDETVTINMRERWTVCDCDAASNKLAIWSA